MTARWPSLSATVASINDIGDVSITSATLGDILQYDGASWVNVSNPWSIDNSYTVGKGGGFDFSTIQAAINQAVTDGASAANPYSIRIWPGPYPENLTLFDGINLVSVNGFYGSTVVVNPTSGDVLTLSAAGASCTVTGIDLVASRTTGTDKLVNINATNSYILFAGGGVWSYTAGADYAVTPVSIVAGFVFFVDTAYVFNGFNGATSNITMMDLGGTLDTEINSLSLTFNSQAASGTEIILNQSGVSEFDMGISPINYNNTNAAFSGSATAVKMGACTAGLERLLFSSPIRANVTPNSGTWTFFEVDSSGAGCEFEVSHCDLFATPGGFTNTYVAQHGTDDRITVDGCVQEEDWDNTGTGSYLNLPTDSNDSGFIGWTGVGAYWSRVTTTFTVLRGGYGRKRSVPVYWDGGQSVTITANATNFVYTDTSGVIQTTTTSSTAFNNGIPLFEVWLDGSNNSVVVKENHPFEFDSSVSRTWHKVFGALISQEGANIDTLSAANRTIELIGDAELVDHGLETTIPDSTGVALTWSVVYTDGSGDAQLNATTTQIPVLYNNSGTPTATTDFIVYRLGVSKDDLNSSSPKYFAAMDTTTYANSAAALSSIEGGNVADFPAEIKELEVARLGYVVIRGSTSAITDIVVDKQTALTVSNSGSAVNQASLVQTDTSTFNNFFSGSQTTVQNCLNIIDNLDPDSARAISMFGTNATTVSIGRTGQLVNFLGQINVTEASSFDALSTFDLGVQINGGTQGSGKIWNSSNNLHFGASSGFTFENGSGTDWFTISSSGACTIGPSSGLTAKHTIQASITSAENTEVLRIIGSGSAGSYLGINNPGTSTWVCGITDGDSGLYFRPSTPTSLSAIYLTTSGAVTLGPNEFTGTHIFNCNSLEIRGSSTTADPAIQFSDKNGTTDFYIQSLNTGAELLFGLSGAGIFGSISSTGEWSLGPTTGTATNQLTVNGYVAIGVDGIVVVNNRNAANNAAYIEFQDAGSTTGKIGAETGRTFSVLNSSGNSHIYTTSSGALNVPTQTTHTIGGTSVSADTTFRILSDGANRARMQISPGGTNQLDINAGGSSIDFTSNYAVPYNFTISGTTRFTFSASGATITNNPGTGLTNAVLTLNDQGGGYALINYQTGGTPRGYMGFSSSNKATIVNNSGSVICLINSAGIYNHNPGTMRAVGVNSGNELGDTTVSRRELKTNFRELDISGAWQLPVWAYDWKATGESDIGCIADEVAQLMPEFAYFDKDGNPDGVNYQKLALAAIKMCQELRAERR